MVYKRKLYKLTTVNTAFNRMNTSRCAQTTQVRTEIIIISICDLSHYQKVNGPKGFFTNHKYLFLNCPNLMLMLVEKNSKGWFRSIDLLIMRQTRYLCATLLFVKVYLYSHALSYFTQRSCLG